MANAQTTEHDWFRLPTDPADLKCLLPEWEPARYLIIAIPTHRAIDRNVATSLAIMIREALDVTDVLLLLDDKHLQNFRAIFELLQKEGISDKIRSTPPHAHSDSAAAQHFIHLLPIPVDTYWVRDFGPLFGLTREGNLCFLDSSYRDVREESPATLSFVSGQRRNDDKVPTVLAGVLNQHYLSGRIETVRSQIQLWGGDIFTDGAGLGVTSTATLVMNGANSDTVNDEFSRYYGLTTMVYLQPLPGRTIKHIDMFFRMTSPLGCMVAEYEPDVPTSSPYFQYMHESIRTTLESNVGILQAHFENPIRLPLPPVQFPEDRRLMLEASLSAVSLTSLQLDDLVLQANQPQGHREGICSFEDAVIETALQVTEADWPGTRSHRMQSLVRRHRKPRPDDSPDEKELAISQIAGNLLQVEKEIAAARLDSNAHEGNAPSTVRAQGPLLQQRLSRLRARERALQDRLEELRPLKTTYFTYSNSVHLKGIGGEKVLVPSFSKHRRYEATVRAKYEMAYPNARIVFIPADGLVEQFGALHCVSCVIPQVVGANRAN